MYKNNPKINPAKTKTDIASVNDGPDEKKKLKKLKD